MSGFTLTNLLKMLSSGLCHDTPVSRSRYFDREEY